MKYCLGVFLIELDIFQLNILPCSIHTGLPLIVGKQKARALATCILFVVFHVTSQVKSQSDLLQRHSFVLGFESLNFYDCLVVAVCL